MLKKIKLIILTILFSTTGLFSQINVNADIDKDSYKEGETVELTVAVDNNSGLHGIYFDIDYDSDIFQLKEVENTVLSNGFPNDGELLYADNPYKSGGQSNSHLIISYTLNGSNVEIMNNGLLAKIRFRVKEHTVDPEKSFRFNFTEYGIVNKSGEIITDSSWRGSRLFKIKPKYQGANISIANPYYYEVFKKDDSDIIVNEIESKETIFCNVTTYFDKGDFSVKIYNEKYPSEGEGLVSVPDQSLLNTPVLINSGFNTIIAELYSNENKLVPIAETSTIMYLAPESEFVNIVSPLNHAFINSDMTVVEVESPYDNVTINNIPGKLIKKSGSINTFSANIWLKKGFNKIKAEATVSGNIRYKDEIDIYYRKNSKHFNLLLPEANETFSKNIDLEILGEIGSQFKEDENTIGSVPNTVTIDVTYFPEDYRLQPVKVKDNVFASIYKLSKTTENNGANYQFSNIETINLDNYANGRLQIDVYKNRDGNTWDDKISRICYLNNDPLTIELLEPNVFSEDILDMFTKIDGFDEKNNLEVMYGNNNVSEQVSINSQGALSISDSIAVADKVDGVSGVIKIEEGNDGSLYALKNSNGSLVIYSKRQQDLQWKEIATREGLFGYDIKYTEKGLFIGASNLYSNTEDGLYLLDNNIIKNVDLPINLPHIQYLNLSNRNLYLYGNFYTDLYSFDIFTLVENNNLLSIPGINKNSFPNNVSIKQFVLASDNNSAVIRTENNDVLLYKKSDSGYNAVNIEPFTAKYAVYGNYTNGDYSAYLFIMNDSSCRIIMSNKKNGKFYTFDSSLEKLTGVQSTSEIYVSFKNDYYNFLYNDGNGYKLLKGQLFFDSLYNKKEEILAPLSIENTLKTYTNNFFITEAGTYYINYGNKPDELEHNDPLAVFYYKYNENNSCNFNYINKDIDGIQGFSFEVESMWKDTDQVLLGYTILDDSDNEVLKYSINKRTLKSFLESSTDDIKITRHYDVNLNRYVVNVTFSKIQSENKYLNFDIVFKSVGNNSPKIYNLTIKKKIPVKLSRSSDNLGSAIYLPVHGYISDKTIKEINIQNNPVAVKRDGSFYHDYKIVTAENSFPIKLDCTNSSTKESAEVNFTVNIIQSKNKISNIDFTKDKDGLSLITDSNGIFKLDQDTIYVSGNYYGLEGASVGYEIYSSESGKRTLLKAGIFSIDNTVDQTTIYTEIGVDNPGTGYKAGRINNQPIKLEPGKQEIVIYCKNPDGKTAEFKVLDNYPEFIYNMPPESQRIDIHNGISIVENRYNMEFVKSVKLPIYESIIDSSYAFTRDYIITGKVESLYNTNLIIKSFTDGITFKNGLDQITIPLDNKNMFSIPVNIVMKNFIEKDFYIGIIPDSPLLTSKKCGIKVHGSKSFRDTNFIPDFSIINQSNIVSDLEKPRIPIRMKFNRDDIPLPGYSFLSLTLNYGKTIEGIVAKDGNEYTLVDKNNSQIYLSDIKQGINRLSWILYYKNPISNDLDTISSSSMQKSGMNDYFFEYNSMNSIEETSIHFSKPFEDKFYGTNAEQLPALNVIKDKKTTFSIMLNNQLLTYNFVSNEGDKTERLENFVLPASELVQGRNELFITYSEQLASDEELTYTFLYDDMEPEVVVEAYKYADDYKTLTDISFYVSEANYASAELHVGENIFPDSTPDLTIMGSDQYRVTWSNVNIENTHAARVKVRIKDLTNQTVDSDYIPLFDEKIRPDTDNSERENYIDLPIFTAPKTIENESGIQDFVEHTKYVPNSFLPRNYINSSDTNDPLICNFNGQMLNNSDNSSRYKFGTNLEISGNIVVVSNDSRSDDDAVYIYEIEGSGIWKEKQKLLPFKSQGSTQFGYTISLSGDYLAVGDPQEKAVYIYERNELGNWSEKQKITNLGNQSQVSLGFYIKIFENTLVIRGWDSTQGQGKLFVFEKNDFGEFIEKQELTQQDSRSSNHYIEISNKLIVTSDYYNKIVDIYKKNVEGSWNKIQRLSAPEESSAFGRSLSIYEESILIGSQGAGYLYEKNNSDIWSLSQKIESTVTVPGDYFGRLVSIFADHLAISSSYYKESGAVIIYRKDNGGMWKQTKIIESPFTDQNSFPFSLSLSNKFVIYGVPNSDNSRGSTLIYSVESDIKTIFNQFNSNNKYLVIRIPKKDILFTDFKNNSICFEVYGKEQNLIDLSIRETQIKSIIQMNELNCKYIEGDNSYFCIIDNSDLSNNFRLEVSKLVPSTGYLLYDKGSLRLNFDDSILIGNRPNYIYTTGTDESIYEDLRFYDSMYTDKNNLSTILPKTVSAEFIKEKPDESLDITFYFWLRPEEEGIGTDSYTEYYQGKDLYKKVLSLPGIHLGFNNNQIQVYKEGVIDPVYPLVSDTPHSLKTSLNWNMILLKFSSNSTASLYLNGVELISDLRLTFNDIKAIQSAGAIYDFSPTDSPDAGFYSIANPTYIDKILTDQEITEIYERYDFDGNRERLYSFKEQNDFGPRDFDLKKITLNNNYIYTDQNANWRDSFENGSLKASSKRENFLKVINIGKNGSIENCVILDNSDLYTRIGVDVRGYEDSFEIIPTSNRSRYYFGNKSGNNGLKKALWYTVSGTVDFLEQGASAKLVLRINNKEQYVDLKKGDFKLIYDNTDNISPSDISLYIETTGVIKLKNNLVLNEGNFRLEKELESSAASTKYEFEETGTISFWYKPLGVNSHGRINHPVVLFDSEYLSIGASSVNGSESKYYLEMKQGTDGTGVVEDTNYKVGYDWQYLQVSYDYTNKLLYFYINGELVYSKEDYPANWNYGSIVGDLPVADNFFIGTNRENSIFAEGYLDDFYIGKYYSKSNYNTVSDYKLYNTEFVNENNEIVLNTVSPEVLTNIDSLRFEIKSIDETIVKTGDQTSFPIDVSNLRGGRYVVNSLLSINGHEYCHRQIFNLNNKPKFSLKEFTPIIFKNNPTNLMFKFSYDRSYQFETDDIIYSGIAVNLKYNDDNDNKTYYIVQDFIDRNKVNWLLRVDEPGSPIEWKPLNVDNSGNILLDIKNFISTTDVEAEFKYFYFKDFFKDDNLYSNNPSAPESIKISSAQINAKIVDSNIQYRLDIDLGGSGSNGKLSKELKNDLQIVAKVTKVDNGNTKETTSTLNSDGSRSLYYDDILVRIDSNTPDYGEYKCILELNYLGSPIITKELDETLLWEEPTTNINPEIRELEIDDFSLLYINRESNSSSASFIVKYKVQALNSINATLRILDESENELNTYCENLSHNSNDNTYVFENIDIPMDDFKVELILEAEDFTKKASVNVSNQVDAPKILLTNSVEPKISYNNVFFSWKGLYEGEYNSSIEYQYQLDGSGWSNASSNNRKIRYYKMAKGSHRFEVKAIYNNKESEVVYQDFYIDINKPVIDKSRISVEEIRNSHEVLKAVKIVGNDGAIDDDSLDYVIVNGKKVSLNKEKGCFTSDEITINKDGLNDIKIVAIDSVGNITEDILIVNNPITTLRFPKKGGTILYSPLTIVGSIEQGITADMEIFLQDPFTSDSDDFTGWKKAKINEDRTFFIEDVLINSGTKGNKISSVIKLVTRFKTGEIFEREIIVNAKELVMPIEMNLSTNVAEGENEDTYVEINCIANVPNISSWSIDYDGDGIYDEIDLVKNPADKNSKKHNWSHKYSSLKQFFPRVRVVTTDNNFFSVSDSLIIHEKIKDASPQKIINPISITTVKTELETDKVFVLRNDNLHNKNLIDIYFIPRYNAQLYNTGQSIDLHSLNIEDAVILKALSEENIFIVSNVDGMSKIYQLRTDDFGYYRKERTLELAGIISDIALDKENLYISFEDSRDFVKVDIVDSILDIDSAKEYVVNTVNTNSLGVKSFITKDIQGLFLTDYENHRIIRLDNEFKLIEQFGSIGDKGGEFINPSFIESYGDRVIIFDEKRNDIQVFDSQFEEQCTLKYNYSSGYDNYVDSEFFKDIADIDILAKEEGDRLYYYALALSRSSSQLSMIRLPQYQELRAKVRNNKIVFIKDGEVFTSKPDGGDIRRVLSTDSIPRIEGTLNYPAISPDGRNIVFTSRIKLYNSGYQSNNGEANVFDYDNLYTVNTEKNKLEKHDLGVINNYIIERPVFNSNGDKIIFSAKKSGEKWSIWIYDLKSKTVERLFDSDENTRFPYYSPDDRFVVFTTDYDGDEDIAIVDTQNISMRTYLTGNSARDSMPVWNAVYPDEISNPKLKVGSKISFVSERDFHKGVYVVYLSRPDESDIRVFNIKTGSDDGDLEGSAIEITNKNVQGDYPCFTGDGKSLFFEYFDGNSTRIKKFSFIDETNKRELINNNPSFIYGDVEILDGARQPSGMKNMISNFKAETTNGNELVLSWDRYTEGDILYTVQLLELQLEDGYKLIPKVVSNQSGTIIKGLKLGFPYKVRVCVIENGKEVTTSKWEDVRIPPVVAKPSFEIDATNPYVVKLNGWAPDNVEKTHWKYTWIIDNVPYSAGQSSSMSFEFSTSGKKIIQLKVDGESQIAPDTAISDAFEVDIVSDIVPVITTTVSDDSTKIVLDATNSLGEKINLSSATWTISGPGDVPQQIKGMTKELDISRYIGRVYVTLTLERILVNGQSSTDIIETTKIVDLNIKDIIPVIDTKPVEGNDRVIIFDGSQSIGNIDWPNVQWSIMEDGKLLHHVNGVTSLSYTFPESNNSSVYTVSLTVPDKRDGKTLTVSRVISIEPTPIEPVIEYKILEYGELDGNIETAKLVLDCTKSLGNNIDFSQAKWTIPLAGKYGDQPTQFGPTAVFSLNNIGKGVVVEVNLALSHKGDSDYKTVTKLISINSDELPVSEVHVNSEVTDTREGKLIKLDVYNSTGGNIDWQNTSWLVKVPGSEEKSYRGPSIQIPCSAVSENSEVIYECVLYRNDGTYQNTSGQFDIKAQPIEPRITLNYISGKENRYVELSVLRETTGANIDWERTQWYIYNGSDAPTVKYGATITHYFPDTENWFDYPVLVKMYHKGSSYEFTGYKSIPLAELDVDPIISEERSSSDPNLYFFNADSSIASNIKWSSTKWNFGDSSPPKYGARVEHKFPANSEGKTYKVTMTLTRVMFNGAQEETFTHTKDITVGANNMKAVINARKVGDILILSAAESEGSGLLLDRSVWLFDGDGDSENYSEHESGTISSSSSTNKNFTQQTLFTDYNETSSQGSGTNDVDSDTEGKSNTFSTQNKHTGAVCRRSIKGLENITISLTVLRLTSDGGTETHTLNININLLKITLNNWLGNGDTYGK